MFTTIVGGLAKLVRKIRFQIGMVNCSEYLKLIELVIDNEASDEGKLLLSQHLKICVKCLEKMEIGIKLKEKLSIRFAKEEVPVGLADDIRTKIGKLTQ